MSVYNNNFKIVLLREGKVMKDLMQKVKSFILFDFPLNPDYIGRYFTNTHNIYQNNISGWSTISTRQKVIASYWLKYVIGHFAFLFGLPSLMILFINFRLEISFLSVLFATGIICFPVLLLFTYLPAFYFQFLPHLETIKENYERKQLEQVEKCRQAQLSNFSLSLFYYVLAKTNNLQAIQSDDKTANLLMRLYGVDAGSLKKNIELILMPVKRKNLSERKITELKNRFSETFAFMKELEFAAGIEELKKLEAQFFRR